MKLICYSIEMDMNNRNAENRSELKEFDLSIEEINNKFTISLGDLRTEIESAKWDATRRAICKSDYRYVLPHLPLTSLLSLRFDGMALDGPRRTSYFPLAKKLTLLAIIGTIVVSVVAVTLFVTDSGPATPATPVQAALPTKPIMRDMSVGTGSGMEEEFDPDSALSEEKLEKILRESGLEMGREKRKKEKTKEVVQQVERI